MDTLTYIFCLVTPRAYMATIDIIPVALEHKKFVRNSILNGNYTTCIVGPRIFTMLIELVLAELRQLEHINNVYFADFYLQGEPFIYCDANVLVFTNYLSNLTKLRQFH